MKKQRTMLALLIATGMGWSADEGAAQLRQKTTNDFMRKKLDYASGVLEGVTLGKFDLVVTNAIPLRNMSMTNAFLVLGNPDYGRAITNFQASVDGLVKAAKEKNQVGTTSAYTDMVRSCVQCHEHFRREQAIPPVK